MLIVVASVDYGSYGIAFYLSYFRVSLQIARVSLIGKIRVESSSVVIITRIMLFSLVFPLMGFTYRVRWLLIRLFWKKDAD